MSQIKKKHIRSKTIWQIFMMFLEIAVIVGGLTLGSSLLWEFESGLDILKLPLRMFLKTMVEK